MKAGRRELRPRRGGPIGLFRDLPLWLKLLAVYGGLFLVAIALGGYISYQVMDRRINRTIDQEFARTTNMAMNVVRTAASVSIRNYLRAVAATDLDLVRGYYDRERAGTLAREDAQARAGRALLTQVIGQTGYPFAWDVGRAPESVVLAVHPLIQGRDVAEWDFVQEAVRLKQGYMEYSWSNPGDPAPREKAMYLVSFEPWNWIIAVSSYREEFDDLVTVEDFRESVQSLRFGQEGGIFILGRDGEMLVPPTDMAMDEQAMKVMRTIRAKGEGSLRLAWRDAEGGERVRLFRFRSMPGLDWVVGCTAYLNEFTGVRHLFRRYGATFVGITLLLFAPASIMLGATLTRPLESLARKFKGAAQGDLGVRSTADYRDEIGDLARGFNTFMDRLQENDLALRRSESRYRGLFENATEGIYRTTTDGRFLSANPALAGMLGYPDPATLIEEVTDIRNQLYANPEDRERYHGVLLSEGMIRDFETRLKRRDGSVIWVALHSRLTREADGSVAIEGILADVTEHKLAAARMEAMNKELERRVRERTLELERSNRELEMANQELESFSYSVSHDLRAPLRAIDGFCQVLLEDYQDKLDQEGRGHLERVRRATMRMEALIDDLLALSRVARAGFSIGPVDISAMAGSALADLAEMEPERRVSVEVEAGLSARGDKGLLRSALSNLLGNAWKYTAKAQKARIVFGREQRDGEQVYFVRDNGAGFDMAYADKLFLPFARLHREEDFEGTGIGLAIVERVVRRHGGRIWAQSEENAGATFYFTLARTP